MSQVLLSFASVQPLFAYLTQEKYAENGWNIYKPIEEFRRQVRRRTAAPTGSGIALDFDINIQDYTHNFA